MLSACEENHLSIFVAALADIFSDSIDTLHVNKRIKKEKAFLGRLLMFLLTPSLS